MNRRTLVVGAVAIAAILFATGAYIYDRGAADRQAKIAAETQSYLVRPHSPVLGPQNAPVTVVEFFDPSCESCRAFYPIVKQILAKYPEDVRVVIRYAPFHEGSDEAVRIMEAARLQNLYVAVKEALLQTQPTWAVHGAPNLGIAWAAAQAVGLNYTQAQNDAKNPKIANILQQDQADLRAAKVRQTPSFFVNGKPLTSFGARQLNELVDAEVEASRKTK
ncbi:DsbA family protein [Leptospira interrogans]